MFVYQKKVTTLKVMGDFEAIVDQVCNQYTCHNKRLYAYINRVCNLIEDFTTFNIKLIPKEDNQILDAFVVVASTLEPMQDSKIKKGSLWN